MYNKNPIIIRGNEPTIISKAKLLLLKKFIKSFLKKTMIANNDPRCKLTSITSELDEKLLSSDSKIRCADELTGINSEIP